MNENVQSIDTVRAACRTAFLISLSAVAPASALAQTYPTKPVRLVVGFAPGGSTDVVARMLARRFGEEFGQSFVVENRSGAGGNIAAQFVARAPSDGYTLLYGTSSAAVSMSLYARPGYRLIEDFAHVAPVAAIPSVLAVHPSLPVKRVDELVALAKRRPGEIAYASAGNGSATHLASELFKTAAGIDLLHVPYKGAGPATSDLIAGHVQMQFLFNALQADAHARGGKLRTLAVTSRERLAVLPELPTMREAGIADFEAIVWNGVFAPAGTPEDVVASLNARTAQSMKALVAALSKMGAYPLYDRPAAFEAFVGREIGKWAQVLRRAGLKAM